MGPMDKPATREAAAKGKRDAWKTLARNKKGKWVKRTSTTEQPAKKRTPAKVASVGKRSAAPRASEAKATQAIAHIEKAFHDGCPRCSGDMRVQKIRCGPERLIEVRKCDTCNYWLPMQTTPIH